MSVVDNEDVGGRVVTEIGPWAMVPAWVLTKGLKPATLVTYVALRSFADRGGDAHPRAETIAERACLSVGTVRNSIQELRSKGLIETTERRRPDGSLAGLVYKLFDLDPTPGSVAGPRRRGEKPGPKPGTQKPRSGAGTPSNVDPSTAPAGTPGNAGGVHQVMQGSTPTNAGRNTPEEHTRGTPSEAAAQLRPGADGDGQITIDGTVEPPNPEQTAIGIAFRIARDWVEYRKEKVNKPVVAASGKPVAAVQSLVLQFVKADYTEDELKRALNGIGEGLPSKGQMQRALDTIRDRKIPGATGRPRQRSAAGVNDHWKGRDAVAAGATTSGGPLPRADAIQTTGGAW